MKNEKRKMKNEERQHWDGWGFTFRSSFLVLHSSLLLSSLCLCVSVVSLSAGEPCQSGLKPGQQPKPYAALVATGPQRGQLHCYICEAEDRPVVIVFARTLSEPLGKLAQKLDKALQTHKDAQLRGWVTFLSDDQAKLDPKVVEWGKKHAISNLPLAVFEDSGGPPSYRLKQEADVTILLSLKQKVVANFAFRAGALNDERIAEVMKALPQIVGAPKKK
jgi:hypothetical protein